MYLVYGLRNRHRCTYVEGRTASLGDRPKLGPPELPRIDFWWCASRLATKQNHLSDNFGSMIMQMDLCKCMTVFLSSLVARIAQRGSMGFWALMNACHSIYGWASHRYLNSICFNCGLTGSALKSSSTQN